MLDFPAAPPSVPRHLARTVRHRLLRLVALLLVPGLAFSAVLTWRIYAIARAGAETALRQTAHGLSQLVDREFVQGETLLHTLAAASELRSGDLAGFERLARATVVMGGRVVLSDPAGRRLVDTSGQRSGGWRAGVPMSDWNGEAIGTPRVWPMVVSSDNTPSEIWIVLPVGIDGVHAYDLSLVLPPSAMQAVLTRERLPDEWVSAIIDPAGTLAARTREPDRFVGRHASPQLWDAIGRNEEGTRDGIATDGTHVVSAYSRSPMSRWSVAVACPEAQVAASGRQSTSTLVVFGVAAIVAGIMLARRMAGGISRPIEALAQSTRALHDARSWASIPPGLAEAEAVSQAMWDAADALARRQADLAELNESLSVRVEERTAELALANAELAARQRDLAAILDQMPVGVMVHRADGELSYANTEARGLLKWDADVLSPAQWPLMRQEGEVLLPENMPGALACRGVATERVLISAQCASGRVVELEVSAAPLRDDQGRVHLAVTVFQDVTARLDAEEARRRSQRLEAVGQLTGGVAHEFNNLLLAITGCLELLSRPVALLDDKRASALLARATRAAGRGSRLTTQLLAFARRQTLQLERLDLPAVLGGMRELLEGTLGRSIEIVVEASPLDWHAWADASQVELMLLNLAINARDAMPEGGRLTLRADSVQRGPPTRAEDPPAGEFAVLHVSDTGHGMPPFVLARAFEPFFTTKEVGRGSGLGLPQVLGVAQQMGGGVSIASTPGVGTTVSVFLPRAGEAAAASVPEFLAAPPLVQLAGARVLVVDDDPDVLAVAAEFLEERGALVTQVDGGPAALLALRTAIYDVMLADLTMPHMTGLQLAAEAHDLLPGLPVVLMTGYGAQALETPGHGLAATLQKPFRAETLANCLANVLATTKPEAN